MGWKEPDKSEHTCTSLTSHNKRVKKRKKKKGNNIKKDFPNAIINIICYMAMALFKSITSTLPRFLNYAVINIILKTYLFVVYNISLVVGA